MRTGRLEGHPLMHHETQTPLKADFERYLFPMRTIHGPWRAWLAAATEFGFMANVVYRLGRWSRTIRSPWLALPVKLVYRILDFLIHVLFGISISSNSNIGPGFYIGHFGGIVIHGDMGTECSIGQGVTIGSRGAGRSDGYPVLGDRVFVGAGAMVSGSVRVGDDVIIGANTVVVTDVPAGCRVVSAASRILPPANELSHRKTQVGIRPSARTAWAPQ